MNKKLLILAAIVAVLVMVNVGLASEQNRNRHCNGQYPCGDPVPDQPDVPEIPNPSDEIVPPLEPDEPPALLIQASLCFTGANHKIFLLGIRSGTEQARVDMGYNNIEVVSIPMYEDHPLFKKGFDIGYAKTMLM